MHNGLPFKEFRDARSTVRIERPRMDPEDLAVARALHEEIMAILSEQPPEETLEEVMSRLRGRPWNA